MTRFSLYTTPLHQIWYKRVEFNGTDYEAVLKATVQVQHEMENDDNAGIIFNAGSGAIQVTFIYGQWTAGPPVFKPLDSLTPVRITIPATNGTVLSFSQRETVPEPRAKLVYLGLEENFDIPELTYSQPCIHRSNLLSRRGSVHPGLPPIPTAATLQLRQQPIPGPFAPTIRQSSRYRRYRSRRKHPRKPAHAANLVERTDIVDRSRGRQCIPDHPQCSPTLHRIHRPAPNTVPPVHFRQRRLAFPKRHGELWRRQSGPDESGQCQV